MRLDMNLDKRLLRLSTQNFKVMYSHFLT